MLSVCFSLADLGFLICEMRLIAFSSWFGIRLLRCHMWTFGIVLDSCTVPPSPPRCLSLNHSFSPAYAALSRTDEEYLWNTILNLALLNAKCLCSLEMWAVRTWCVRHILFSPSIWKQKSSQGSAQHPTKRQLLMFHCGLCWQDKVPRGRLTLYHGQLLFLRRTADLLLCRHHAEAEKKVVTCQMMSSLRQDPEMHGAASRVEWGHERLGLVWEACMQEAAGVSQSREAQDRRCICYISWTETLLGWARQDSRRRCEGSP